jgi:hypothetical protein
MRVHTEFALEPFRKVNKDGSVSNRISSPVTLKWVTIKRNQLLAAWDEYKVEEKEASPGKGSGEVEKDAKKEGAVLPSRPNVELARYLVR